MKEIKCKWLPSMITLEDYNGIWEDYNNALYEYFKTELLNSSLSFNGKKIRFRINPKEKNFEHSFIHLTCKHITGDYTDVNNRLFDPRRSEKITWIKPIIEHYPCNENCEGCRKILYYEEYYKSNIRINLVFIDKKYKVILEERKNYILLITGYYLNYDKNINNELKKYNEYKKQKTPLV